MPVHEGDELSVAVAPGVKCVPFDRGYLSSRSATTAFARLRGSTDAGTRRCHQR